MGAGTVSRFWKTGSSDLRSNVDAFYNEMLQKDKNSMCDPLGEILRCLD